MAKVAKKEVVKVVEKVAKKEVAKAEETKSEMISIVVNEKNELLAQTEDGTQKKLSYEELNQVANQAVQQAQAMHKKLQETNQQGLITRLEFLFKVLEFKTSFREAFVVQCAREVESMLTPPVQPTE